jgi:prophage regulatory protein
MKSTDQLIRAVHPDALQDANGASPRTYFGSMKARPEADRSQWTSTNTLAFRRSIRRADLHKIVPLADTTIYEMERRGEFPQRFFLTSRCVVWDLAEVEAWVAARRQASNSAQFKRAPAPDVRRRKRRPVRAVPAS